jgi:dethiobiotin synthetase
VFDAALSGLSLFHQKIFSREIIEGEVKGVASFFITGTDTGVGKTRFTCWLVRSWQEIGHKAAALKPISTGDREDARLLGEASKQVLTLDEINPVHFREPAAPQIAAEAENRAIDFSALNRGIQEARARFTHLAVEGVGGWRVPLAKNYEVRDWALDLGFPVVVVARGSLGTLNHTLLTIESVASAGLACAGIIINAGAEEGSSPDLDLTRNRNVAYLRDLLGLPLFEFDRRAQASGHVPLWLGGK